MGALLPQLGALQWHPGASLPPLGVCRRASWVRCCRRLARPHRGFVLQCRCVGALFRPVLQCDKYLRLSVRQGGLGPCLPGGGAGEGGCICRGRVGSAAAALCGRAAAALLSVGVGGCCTSWPGAGEAASVWRGAGALCPTRSKELNATLAVVAVGRITYWSRTPTVVRAMRTKVPARDAVQMEQLRELLRSLLAVTALPADLSELVAKLFQDLHQLELRCPQLYCHMHVSGVSQTTGRSFFVVLHDAALMANNGAKRVVKTIYTHLHSAASMATTAALWQNSISRQGQALPPGHPLRDAAPVAGAEPIALGGNPQASAQPLRTAEGAGDGGCAPKEAAPPSMAPFGAGSADGAGAAVDTGDPATGEDGVGGAAAPLGDPGGAVHAGSQTGRATSPPLADDGDAFPASPLTSDAVALSSGLDNFAMLSSRYRAPAAHFPSLEATERIEALFTALSRGWTALLRTTLSEVRVALSGIYNVKHKPALTGMMGWLPIDLLGEDGGASEPAGGIEASATRGPGGKVLPECAQYPYPVMVRKRHLQTGERSRDAKDMDVEVVRVVHLFPSRGSGEARGGIPSASA